MKRRHIAEGQKQYNGKICRRHPLLDGLRYVYSCACVGCKRDAAKAQGAQRISQPPPEPPRKFSDAHLIGFTWPPIRESRHV